MTKTALISINSAWNIYHFRATLVAALKGAGYRVVSAAPNDPYTPRLLPLVDAHYPLPMQHSGTSVFGDALLFLRYVRLLQKIRPAVLLTYTIKPNIYGALAARLLGIPVLANISGLGTAFIRQSWLTKLVCLLYRFALSGAHCVFFQNPEDRAYFIEAKLVPAEKTALLAGSGINLEYFHPAFCIARPTDAPIAFVLIARLLWDKGIGEYIAAARLLRQKFPQCIFRLVGPTGVHNKTAIPESAVRLWKTEGIIEYLGESSDVRSILAQHDCVVLPSYREGMPRVLLEAAAMGKPIITTNVPGCRQAVEPLYNGFWCEARDAASLAAAMEQFLALSPAQRQQMGQNSRHKAEAEFDEQKVIAAYLEKIAQIAA